MDDKVINRLGIETTRYSSICNNTNRATATLHQVHFSNVMRTAHAEPTHSGLLRNKSALTTIADAEPTMRKTQV